MLKVYKFQYKHYEQNGTLVKLFMLGEQTVIDCNCYYLNHLKYIYFLSPPAPPLLLLKNNLPQQITKQACRFLMSFPTTAPDY
jgi:hypothetical protein